jgi:hypothetical protein
MTPNLPQAAFVVARGHTVKRLDPALPGEFKRSFVFDGDAAKTAGEFYTGGKVEARAFANAWRDLRALLFPRY